MRREIDEKIEFFDSQVKFQVGIKNHRNLEPSDSRKSSSRASGVPNFATLEGAKNGSKMEPTWGHVGPKIRPNVILKLTTKGG